MTINDLDGIELKDFIKSYESEMGKTFKDKREGEMYEDDTYIFDGIGITRDGLFYMMSGDYPEDNLWVKCDKKLTDYFKEVV